MPRFQMGIQSNCYSLRYTALSNKRRKSAVLFVSSYHGCWSRKRDFFSRDFAFFGTNKCKICDGSELSAYVVKSVQHFVFPPLFCLGWLKASTCKRLPRGACCFCFTFRFYLCREKAGAVHILCFSHRCEWSRHRARLALCEEVFRCLVVQMVKVPRLRCIWFSFNRLWQWFTNFWLRTICGSRTVNTYHLGPVKLNLYR